MGMAGEVRALHLGRSGVLAFLVPPLEGVHEGETRLTGLVDNLFNALHGSPLGVSRLL